MIRRTLALAFLIWIIASAPASAGPLVALIGGLISTIGGTWFGSLVLGIVTKLGVSYLMDALFGQDEKPKGAKIEMDNGGDKPPRIVMGVYGTAGHLLYHNSRAENSSIYVAVIILSVKPIGGISNYVTVTGERCTINWGVTDAEGFSAVNEYVKDGYPFCRMKCHTGGQNSADPYLVAKFGTDPDWAWAADMIVRGCAYVIVECSHSSDGVWAGSPTFVFTVSGMPLYDPRRDSTVGGSGAHRWADESTWGGPGDTNPIVQKYNIIRGIRDYDGSFMWGGRASAYQLPLDYWFAAMNVADEEIEKKNGDIIARFASGLEFDLSEQPLNVILDIDRGCNGYTTEYGGTYKTWCGPPGLPVMTITDDDWLVTETATDTPYKAISETYNSAIATYPEPKTGWTMEPGPLYVDEDFLSEDGNEPLQASISLRTVTESNQVQRLVRAAIKDSRAMLSHTGTFPPEFSLLEPHDVIAVQSARNGYHGAGVNMLIGSCESRPNLLQDIKFRSINPNAFGWVKEQEVDQTVGRLGIIRRGVLDLGLTVSPGQVDAPDGGKDLPAIDVTWAVGAFDLDVDRIHYWVRRQGTTKILAEGQINRVNDGAHQIRSSALRFGRNYQVQFYAVPKSSRRTAKTAWQNVTTILVDVPSAPILTVIQKAADDGTAFFKLDIDWPNVAGAPGYVVRTIINGVSRRWKAADNTRRIDVESSDVIVVDVATRARNGDIGDFSPTASITIPKRTQKPPRPTLLEVTPGHKNNRLRVNRFPSPEIKAVVYFRAEVNDFALAVEVDTKSGTSHFDGGLANGTDYWYWAMFETGTGVRSDMFPTSATNGRKGTPSKILAGDVGAGAIGETELADNSVPRRAIKPKAISEAELDDGSVPRRAIKPKAISADEIDDNAVPRRALAPKAVGENELDDGSVPRRAIKPKAISETELDDGSVVRRTLPTSVVDTDKIEPGAVSGFERLAMPKRASVHYDVRAGSTVTPVNWSGNSDGVYYTETVILAAKTIDNESSNRVTMTGKLSLVISAFNDGHVGGNKSLYDVTLYFEGKPTSKAWASPQTKVLEKLRLKDDAKGTGDLKNKAKLLPVGTSHKPAGNLGSDWDYRVRLTVIHKSGDGSEIQLLKVVAFGAIDLSWSKR